MRHSLIASIIGLWLAMPITTWGQQTTPTAADSMAKLIGPQTLFVGRIHLDDEGVLKNLKQLQDEFLSSGLLKHDSLPMMIDQAIDAISALRQSGGHDLFFTLGIADLRRPELLAAISLQDVVSRDDVEKALHKFVETLPLNTSDLQDVQLGTMMVTGPRKAIERLKLAATGEPLNSQQRKSLDAAMAAVDGTAIQLFIVPSSDQRRVLIEMLPDLPSEFGGGLLGALWADIQWVAVGLDLRGSRSLKVIAQASDAQAAANATEQMKQLFTVLGNKKALQKPVQIPQLEEILQLLNPTVQGDQIVMVLDDKEGGLKRLSANVFAPAIAADREASRRKVVMNRMKQFGIAFHNSANADKEERFPDVASRDAQGKPLLSWRVHVLPYIDQHKLYQQFHLDEPWDSPHNRQLIEKMPQLFAIPGSPSSKEGKTCFQVPVGPKTIFPDGRGRSIRDIIDGLSNTILLVEVAEEHAVPWTKPEDWQFNPQEPLDGLGDHLKGNIFVTVFADGSTRVISRSADPEFLRGVFTAAGREVLKFP